jgi:hypothetical protein
LGFSLWCCGVFENKNSSKVGELKIKKTENLQQNIPVITFLFYHLSLGCENSAPQNNEKRAGCLLVS